MHELDNGPRPLPLQSGFSVGTAYRVLGCFNPSETSDAYYILASDRDEIWFICNRYVRVVALDASHKGVRYPLDLSLHH
ncbi:MAG: hypothetical protein ACR5LC_10165 [Symbiopectobacterium sp.]|uniref:hypothetical protein n=1 Tax=Symbiopectobacterium sp. TaxID=2952789 RepID=UPI003F3B8CD0